MHPLGNKARYERSYAGTRLYRMIDRIPFRNDYTRLPKACWEAVRPTPVASPRVVVWNAPLAEELGLTSLDKDECALVFSGNHVPSTCFPIAMAYAGHQFGHFVPMLGDGRALLLGEMATERGICEVQLKGAGRTPFSRGGDGRAALGPMLREYVVSEWMARVGVPTTRSLAVIATGDPVLRDSGPEPGAILVRVATSHLRVGTFEYFAAREDREALFALLDFAVTRHDPDLQARDHDEKVILFFRRVASRQAKLIAKWMSLGFIHGVMNTDNTALSGETLDYGPCAFLDGYDPHAVFSSIDRPRRYAYENQPLVAQWNLTRFAEALAPLLSESPGGVRALETELRALAATFEQEATSVFLAKLGLSDTPRARQLLDEWMGLLREHRVDFTNAFLALRTDTIATMQIPELSVFAAKWASLAHNTIHAAVSPAIIPRNHVLENALHAARSGDFTPFERMCAALEHPEGKHDDFYARGAHPGEWTGRTFCGT